MASLKDYYDILGIKRSATDEDIEKAYRKLARAYHVDSHSGNRAAEIRFQEIAEAYAVLSDKDKRAKYDQAGINFSHGQTGRDLEWEEEEEICNFEGFEEFFKESFEREKASDPNTQKGKEIHCTLPIEFEEAVRGTVAEIQVEEEAPCPECLGQGLNLQGPLETCRECGGAGQIQVGLFPEVFTQRCRRCQGRGRIRQEVCLSCNGAKRRIRRKRVALTIPPGVGDRCRIFLKGAGAKSWRNGSSGDLVVTLEVRKHPFFKKKGDDIYLEVPVTAWEAALGAKIRVPTLDGYTWATISPGTQNGQEMHLKGKGGPSLHGPIKGSQILVFKVIVPQGLDRRSLDLLRRLKQRNSCRPRVKCGWERGRKRPQMVVFRNKRTDQLFNLLPESKQEL